MSRLISLILLSLLMVPLAGLFYFMVFVLIIENSGWRFSQMSFVITGILTWVFIATYWILLWRQSVNWTPRRVNRSLVAFVVAFIAAFIVGAVVSSAEEEIGYFVGSAAAPLLWQVMTIFIWRETAQERSQRLRQATGHTSIVCPTCGYNMTGLKGTRCPECGSEFTLDEILAGQPGQAAAEIEG